VQPVSHGTTVAAVVRDDAVRIARLLRDPQGLRLPRVKFECTEVVKGLTVSVSIEAGGESLAGPEH